MRLVRVPGVFQPISDTRMLADCLLREEVSGATVLDLCTGSGLLALTAAEHGAAEVVAVDVSRRALFSVRLNARCNGLRVGALRGSLFEPVRGRRFDLIVSNPPYVPSESTELPTRGPARAWDAGPDGRAFLEPICARVAEHLNPGGVILLVQNALVGEQETLDALSRHGLEASVAFRHHGGLGPRLRARAHWLRARGLLQDERDEVLIMRGQAPRISPMHPAHEVSEGNLLG